MGAGAEIRPALPPAYPAREPLCDNCIRFSEKINSLLVKISSKPGIFSNFCQFIWVGQYRITLFLCIAICIKIRRRSSSLGKNQQKARKNAAWAVWARRPRDHGFDRPCGGPVGLPVQIWQIRRTWAKTAGCLRRADTQVRPYGKRCGWAKRADLFLIKNVTYLSEKVAISTEMLKNLFMHSVRMSS